MPQDPSSSVVEYAVDSDRLIEELMGGLRETAEAVVPWFLRSMPLVYFQDTSDAERLSHLRAIIAAKASNRPLELTLRSEDGSQWTLIRPLDYPGVLAELVRELPHDRHLRSAKIHTATDGRLVLNTFEFGEPVPYDADDPEQADKLRRTLEYAAEHMPDLSSDTLADYLSRCSAEYAMTVTPLRICKHYDLFRQLTGTDGAAVILEAESDPGLSRIVVAVGNSTTRVMMERIATRLARSSVNIHRAYLDVIDDRDSGSISLLGFVAQTAEGVPIDPQSPLWHRVRRDLLHLKWLDDRTLDLAYRHSQLSLTKAETLMALCHLVHQVLVKVNPHAFDRDRVEKLAERNLTQSIEIVDLLLARFDPDGPVDDATFEQRCAELRRQIEGDVDLESARTLLNTMIDAVAAVLRTNVFLEHRYGLAFRIDPAFLATSERDEIPYGVFFVHGRSFDGFHVRFRDIARGGVRAIRTIGTDQHSREAERLYDEAYNLAMAQQLKNKDIPEGGSKAAVLVEPDGHVPRAVKAFVDGILDLISPDAATRRLIIDRFGREELLYFGPDENITPDLIDWIVARAERRGYPIPNALMSSKPGAGINHKRYGVTSEGVTVFLEVALRQLGYDPVNRPFTVKITGGPDGDVAGNEIKILHRAYGANARIVGIADGSGCGEDPDGLDHEELLRLVEHSLPISQFDRAKLGSHGRIVSIDEPDGVQLRNTMHNRVTADAFIPAGGRPNAIHGGNWRQFMLPGGAPSSPLIVEGANLFLTPDARRELSDVGVLIIKDSSANKCGVICSSYEIAASMLLNEEEFLDIKPVFVEQVLEKLRELARREAELLMRLHMHHPQVPLPEMSIRLSRVMTRTSDAIEAAMPELLETSGDLMRQLVLDHLPRVLINTAGTRLWEHMPPAYLNWLMAKSLAARITYREGFEYLESMPLGAIARVAVRYLAHERERDRLVHDILGSDLPTRQRIADLLDKAGILSTIESSDT